MIKQIYSIWKQNYQKMFNSVHGMTYIDINFIYTVNNDSSYSNGCISYRKKL